MESGTIRALKADGHPLVNRTEKRVGGHAGCCVATIHKGYLKKERILAFIDRNNRRPSRESDDPKERKLARCMDEFIGANRQAYDEAFAEVVKKHLDSAKRYRNDDKEEREQVKKAIRAEKEREKRLLVLREIVRLGRFPAKGEVRNLFISRYYPSGELFDTEFADLCRQVRLTLVIPEDY